MKEAVDVDVLQANDRDESSRVSRIGKVMAASTLVAGSIITGVNAGTPDDHATRDAAVSLTTQVRTLRGVIPWSIDTALNGAVCNKASGNTCTDLVYPYLLADLGVAWGTEILADALQDVSSPEIIFGYSSGAVVASQWLAQHATDADAPSARKLSFILIGNPKRKYGGANFAYTSAATTPNSQYTVLDVAHEYDNVADAPNDPWNLLAMANSIAGYFYVHTAYSVDLVNDEKLVWKEGNTTYVLVRSKDLPLLAPMLWPLRFFGLNFLADAINAPLKTIVDWAYNRNYPGLITDPVEAQKAVDDALRGPSATTSVTTSAKGATDIAAAAALVAASNLEAPSAPTVSEAAPAVAKALSQDAVETKPVAAEDVKGGPSVDTPATTEASATAPDATTDTHSTTDPDTTTGTDTTTDTHSKTDSDTTVDTHTTTDPDTTTDTNTKTDTDTATTTGTETGQQKQSQDDSSGTSSTDNSESVGRHRAPEDTASTTS